MTQKIFDTDNEEDMALLWSILPDDIEKICVEEANGYNKFCYKKIGACEHSFSSYDFIQIDWHDKTEITRPIQECTEQDAGKICAFWDDDGPRTYGLLSDLIIEESDDRKYGCHYGRRWTHARRLTKEEIEELC